MKIYIAELKDGQQLRVQKEYDPVSLDVEFVDLKYLKPVLMQGVLEKNLDVVTFEGSLSSEVQHMCGRCLKTATEAVIKPFKLFYHVKDLAEIETIDDLRETLIMDHPITYLCAENCKGLCPQCGTDWNNKSCQCKPAEEFHSDSSLSSLKKAWQKKHGGNK